MASRGSHGTIYTARQLVADLGTPAPTIYWTDFLASVSVAYGAAAIYLAPVARTAESLQVNLTTAWSLRLTCLLISSVALYRTALFMHEIVHLRRGQMVPFKVAWNIIAGIPMLMPSYFYECHIAHHNTHHYGTADDGEYLPLGGDHPRAILWFLGQAFLLPLFVAFRFAVLAPLSFLHPRLRVWVLEHASSFVINFRYRRPIPSNAPRAAWLAMDVACWLRITVLLVCFAIGIVGWPRLAALYVLAFMTLGMNHLRTLVAHRYLSDGDRMSHAEQLEDSINVTGSPIVTEMLFPVGLRYHALHHLFPALPYHNLPTAHRRLMAHLPPDSAYHNCNFPNFWAALGALIRSACSAAAAKPTKAQRWFAQNKSNEAAPPQHEPNREKSLGESERVA